MKQKRVLLIVILTIIVNFVFCTNIYADELNINAESAISVEMSTGKVVYEKDAHIFVVGFAQGSYPKSVKDNDYAF